MQKRIKGIIYCYEFLNGTVIQLTDGQLKAINYLTQTLDLYDRD